MKIKPNHFTSLASKHQIERKDGKKYTIRDNRHRYFFPDEWVAFHDSLKAKQKITFHFLINTGARINEVRNIKVMDIDKDRQSILLRFTKSRNKDGSRKIRIIKVSPQFIKYINGLINQYDLKPNDYFPILSTPAANIAMKKTLREIGISDYYMFSVHNVRKTLETWLLALDIDSLKVAKHFGHSIIIAGKFYVEGDVFNYEDKRIMREVIGDLYAR